MFYSQSISISIVGTKPLHTYLMLHSICTWNLGCELQDPSSSLFPVKDRKGWDILWASKYWPTTMGRKYFCSKGCGLLGQWGNLSASRYQLVLVYCLHAGLILDYAGAQARPFSLGKAGPSHQQTAPVSVLDYLPFLHASPVRVYYVF